MSEQVLHKGLTPERWNQFPIDRRLAMIASEFGRAISALEREDRAHAGDCYQRARELVILTLQDVEQQHDQAVSSLLREIERTIDATNAERMPLPELLAQSQHLDARLSDASWALHDGKDAA